MRQVLQELGTGRTLLAEVPEPGSARGSLRVCTRRSLISAGTERMLVEFGRAGWIERARQQPERVRQVLGKIRTDGLIATVEAVRSKLDQTIALGYCNVGTVDDTGAVDGFSVGDRVVSNGPHAEVVSVPSNLCARVPDGVSDEAASFTVVAAIGLQGVRLAAPALGETFVVTGLGLIGLITVQLLRANGCRVLGIDPDPRKTELARRFGATTVEIGQGEDPLLAAESFTRGRGMDGVLITASTQSDEPVSQAARMCRKRGRIILVGVAGLQLNRADFYEKELSFQVSCSYGPGRYDPAYERDGHDYPFGLVRWTEQRNFEAVLDLLAAGTLDVQPLVTHRFALADAPRAYDILAGNTEPYLGIVLEYGQRASAAPPQRTIQLAQLATREPQPGAAPALGVIGAGNYAARVLIPAFVRGAPRLIAIASNGGVTAAHLGRKFGFAEVSTDAAAVISDPRVNVVVIATRHDTHAALAAQALRAGKHVFVEKPLALTLDELEALEVAYAVHNVQTAHADRADQASQASQAGDVGQAGRRPLLMVGFNRRFAPHVRRMKSLLQTLPGPKSLLVTVNAGAIPGSHWTQSVSEGGGRLVGEGCHFIDLMRFLTGAPITGWQVAALGSPATGGFENDKVTVTLSFADGSVGTLHYLASGHASFPKERVEVFCGGRILQLDNFRRLRGFGFGARGSLRLWRQDKGQEACVSAFLEAVRAGTPSPIPFAELLEVSRFSIAVGEAARQQGFAPCPP